MVRSRESTGPVEADSEQMNGFNIDKAYEESNNMTSRTTFFNYGNHCHVFADRELPCICS
jgi:hypothetical protein